MASPALVFVLVIASIALLVPVMIYIVAPLLKGVGIGIGWIFRAIGWLILHLFEFIGGTISDVVRFIGAVIALVVFMPMAFLSLVVGRWSAAGHFADSVKREFVVGGKCLYRVTLRRPLKLFYLHGLLEGVEQRVPEAVAAAPTADRPRRRVGQFPGYEIVGSLKAGGSGAKLYVAVPEPSMQARYPGMPDRVVIKCFALSEGSALPQIVRESRALEAAKQLGLVFDHGMDDHRFYYVMPYHAGDHLGIVTRQLHAESGERGLERRQLGRAVGYVSDLARTLATYHVAGLWHKDVKPENVIVHDGRAHLVDLGLVTPLRSAMTLTTHGTEYFRDPELVRQALRGVKVHQVDGAKFDIYAVGAVLYFLIENTFPAHGALSRFARRSPESLRWIVRRAMADYQHRYESANLMLADLQFVAASADPFAIKPADLPSMSGAGFDVAASVDSEPRADEHSAPPPLPVTPAASSAVPSSGRPRLTVTNWWTGAYRPADGAGVGAADLAAAAASAAAAEVAPIERAVASAYRHDEADLRHKVRTGVMSPRRAAQEQLKAARHRARDMRKRANASRRRATGERQPSFTLIGIAAVMLVALIGGAMAIKGALDSSRRYHAQVDSAAGVLAPGTVITTATADPAPQVLLVPTLRTPEHPYIMEWTDRMVNLYREQGYEIIVDNDLVTPELQGLVLHARADADEATTAALESVMEAHGLYGILNINQPDRDRASVTPYLFTSNAESARDRRYDPTGHAHDAAPALPYLLVNDHPTKHDPTVLAKIERRLEELGLAFGTDDVLEVTVRSELPVLGTDQATPELPAGLYAALRAAGYGGLVYATAPGGAAPAAERGVLLHVFDADRGPAAGASAMDGDETIDVSDEIDDARGAGDGDTSGAISPEVYADAA